jgi:hypothetical protein
MKRTRFEVPAIVCLMLGLAEAQGAATPSQVPATSVVRAGVTPVRLVLRGAAAEGGPGRIRLLPDPQALTDGDAYPLYQAAIKALPINLNRLDQIPLNLFSVEEAKPTIKDLAPALAELHNAARCRTCAWPEVKPGAIPEGQSEVKQLAYVLASQAHYHLAKGEYPEAAKVLSTGLAMARHLGQARDLTQELVGVAVGTLMCHEVEQWVQCPNSPSLFEAIKALPRPFIDPNAQIQKEIDALRANPKYLLIRKSLEKTLQPAHDRVRLTAKGLDRRIAALQDIEAIRIYAGKQGRLPNAISEVGMPVPNDPLTDKPFAYTVKNGAVLEGPVPDGGTERDGLRYELTWTRDKDQ